MNTGGRTTNFFHRLVIHLSYTVCERTCCIYYRFRFHVPLLSRDFVSQMSACEYSIAVLRVTKILLRETIPFISANLSTKIKSA